MLRALAARTRQCMPGTPSALHGQCTAITLVCGTPFEPPMPSRCTCLQPLPQPLGRVSAVYCAVHCQVRNRSYLLPALSARRAKLPPCRPPPHTHTTAPLGHPHTPALLLTLGWLSCGATSISRWHALSSPSASITLTAVSAPWYRAAYSTTQHSAAQHSGPGGGGGASRHAGGRGPGCRRSRTMHCDRVPGATVSQGPDFPLSMPL